MEETLIKLVESGDWKEAEAILRYHPIQIIYCNPSVIGLQYHNLFEKIQNYPSPSVTALLVLKGIISSPDSLGSIQETYRCLLSNIYRRHLLLLHYHNIKLFSNMDVNRHIHSFLTHSKKFLG